MERRSPYISALLGSLIAGFISMLFGCVFAKFLGFNWPGGEEFACTASGQTYGLTGMIAGAIFSFLLTKEIGDKATHFFAGTFVVLVVLILLSFVWLGFNAI